MGANTAALPALQQPSMRKWRLRVYTAQSTRLAHCCTAAPGAVLRSISARPWVQVSGLSSETVVLSSGAVHRDWSCFATPEQEQGSLGHPSRYPFTTSPTNATAKSVPLLVAVVAPCFYCSPDNQHIMREHKCVQQRLYNFTSGQSKLKSKHFLLE